jgi:capsular polysaccharide biosynthesis protein
MKNPQIFNQFQEIRKTNNNPEELLKQITGKYTPEQMQNFMKFANNMGITTEQLNQFGINTK